MPNKHMDSQTDGMSELHIVLVGCRRRTCMCTCVCVHAPDEDKEGLDLLANLNEQSKLEVSVEIVIESFFASRLLGSVHPAGRIDQARHGVLSTGLSRVPLLLFGPVSVCVCATGNQSSWEEVPVGRRSEAVVKRTSRLLSVHYRCHAVHGIQRTHAVRF